jgi:hypothetical protein
MVRQYVLLAVILSMIFFAIGCAERRPADPVLQEQPKSSNDMWNGYGDVDKTAKPKYLNMPPLKK